MTRPASRRVSRRIVEALASAVMIVGLAGVAALHTKETGSAVHATTDATPTVTRDRPGSARASASLVPPARFGRAGREVTILAFVNPPRTGRCLSISLPGHTQPYRLTGDWATRDPGTPSDSGQGQLWWLTGHTLPRIDTADHAPMAPPQPECGTVPIFSVDAATSLADWLSSVINAVLAPAPQLLRLPSTITAPTTGHGTTPPRPTRT